jgi:protein required for attachment to host cells
MWIVIADGGRGRVLKANNAGRGIAPALDHELVADTRPGREINADRPGRTKDRMAQGRHAYEPPTDPRENEQIEFARQIARLLDDERKQGSYGRLAIIAPPKMLGLLREAMTGEVRDLVSAEIAKDLTKLPLHELEKRLPELL